MKLDQLATLLLSLIFPLRCITCGERIKGGVLCNNCRSRVVISEGFVCPICRRHSKDPYFPCHPTNFLLLTSASFQQKEVQDLVHTLKYRGLKSSTEEMADIMALNFKEYLLPLLNPEQTLFIPTPLHSKRLRERGFNQSE